MKKNKYQNALEEELKTLYPGAKFNWSQTGKHPKLTIDYNGKSKMVGGVCSSPSDVRGMKNQIKNIKQRMVM